MWLLLKETAKGIFWTLIGVCLTIIGIKLIIENKQEWYITLCFIISIPVFLFSVIEHAYFTILLPSKLRESYSSFNEIMLSKHYIFEKEYIAEKTLIFEKRIYLNKIEKIILDKDGENETDDIFFDLLIEYEQKKIYITNERSIAKFFEYFLETLEGFDKSIQSEKGIDISKIEIYPITLYAKGKLL